MVGIYQETINDYTNPEFWDEEKSWWAGSSGLYCTNVWTDYPHGSGGVSAISLTAINKGNLLTWLIENDAEHYRIRSFNIYTGNNVPEIKINQTPIRNGAKKYHEFGLLTSNENTTCWLEINYRDGNSELVPFER